MSQARVPAWISVGVLPAINILLAFLVSAILFYYLDISPIDAAEIMWYGAFGTGEGLGFTLYYATGFIFTGLAVAVAFHAGLFNIGGEGQAYIGGLGVGLVCLLLGDVLPFALLLPLAIIAGGLFGAAWAFIPAWLQAKRGSHIGSHRSQRRHRLVEHRIDLSGQSLQHQPARADHRRHHYGEHQRAACEPGIDPDDLADAQVAGDRDIAEAQARGPPAQQDRLENRVKDGKRQ